MSSYIARIRDRIRIALAFAAAGQDLRDSPALFLAGVARGRPFDGDSAYARLGRLIGQDVYPRMRSASGLRVGLDLRDVTDLMILEEIFIDGIYPLDLIPFEPDTIVDCGACAGFFSILSYGRYPMANLHLFEPEPGNVDRLRRNLALNNIPGCIHPAAVGVVDGIARFAGQGFGGHITAGDEAETTEVTVVGLPAFLRQTAGSKLLLKIDIEGAEESLLPTLSDVLPRATSLFLETHHDEATCRSYLQPLLDAGFIHSEIRRRHDSTLQVDFVERVLIRT